MAPSSYPSVSLRAACLLLVLGCTQTQGSGTLSLELSGGNGVEAPLPASEFQDGWTLAFSELLVVFSDVSVSTTTNSAMVARQDKSVLVDLVKRGPTRWATMKALEGAYNRAAFSVKPANGDTTALNASTEQLQRMVTGGFSLLASGSLSKGTVHKNFSWAFSPEARFTGCVLTVGVDPGQESLVRVVVHGEQLFLDSLGRDTPRFRAQSQVDADANNDGDISNAELAAIHGAAFTALTYPSRGSVGFVDSLAEFEEEALLRSIRMPGETSCPTVAVDSPLSTDGGVPDAGP